MDHLANKGRKSTTTNNIDTPNEEIISIAKKITQQIWQEEYERISRDKGKTFFEKYKKIQKKHGSTISN